jgi:hypothetical protein
VFLDGLFLVNLLLASPSQGGWLFAAVPLAALDWLWIVLVSSSIWIADEILKRLVVHGHRPGRE